jgi:chloramphenicol O-acetyltransferase type A
MDVRTAEESGSDRAGKKSTPSISYHFSTGVLRQRPECEQQQFGGSVANMKRKVDIENWIRKAHFQFFSKFEEPYYGVCVTMNCSAAYQFAKRNGLSFFLYCLHRSRSAAQTIEPFKHRIEMGEVFLYDQIDAGSTIARSNGTFGYGHIIYCESLEEFLDGANREVERVRSSSDLTRTTADNIIRYSALPWIDFTSISHARMFSIPDSCPRISFGKMTESAGRRSMPVSIHVHHAF